MASDPKKRRTEDVEKKWSEAIMTIIANSESGVTLTPLKIVCCNAFPPYFGTSFSKAFCDTKPYEARLLFGDVFQKGVSILRDFEETKKVPTDRKTLFVFNKLMDFLNGGKKNENYIF